jgi:hypothetical protein
MEPTMQIARSLLLGLAAVLVPPALHADDGPAASQLRDVAAGRRTLSTLVDSSRGVAFVEVNTNTEDYSGDAAWERRVVHGSERTCGSALAARMARIEDDLRRRFAPDSETPMTCTDLVCVHRGGGEFDHEGVYRFRRMRRGLVLDSVVWIESGPLSDEFLARAARVARRIVRRLAHRRCR